MEKKQSFLWRSFICNNVVFFLSTSPRAESNSSQKLVTQKLLFVPDGQLQTHVLQLVLNHVRVNKGVVVVGVQTLFHHCSLLTALCFGWKQTSVAADIYSVSDFITTVSGVVNRESGQEGQRWSAFDQNSDLHKGHDESGRRSCIFRETFAGV